MKQSQSIDINGRIQDVFEYTNTNEAEWSLIVVEDTLLESVNDGGVGSTFRIVTEESSQKMEFTSEVTLYDPPIVPPSICQESSSIFRPNMRSRKSAKAVRE